MIALSNMIINFINQLFGYSPNIHDIVIAVVSILFGLILLPQLKDVLKGKSILNLYTCSLTTIGLIILTTNFYIMKFWISFLADFFSAIIWFLLFLFSLKNAKKNKS